MVECRQWYQTDCVNVPKIASDVDATIVLIRLIIIMYTLY